jgi:hypothetical protein
LGLAVLSAPGELAGVPLVVAAAVPDHADAGPQAPDAEVVDPPSSSRARQNLTVDQQLASRYSKGVRDGEHVG